MYFITKDIFSAVIITIQPWTVDQFECLSLPGSLDPNLPQAGPFSVLSCTVPYRAVRRNKNVTITKGESISHDQIDNLTL